MLRAKKIRLMALAALCAVFTAAPALAGILVTPGWLAAHANDPDLVIVDVQNKPQSYARGHIPGAVRVVRHVDLEDPYRYPTNKYPGREQFVALMKRLGIGNHTTVVAYDDHHDIFASRFFFVMELYGHDTARLKLLDGGIKAWLASGRKLSTAAARPENPPAYTTSGPNLNLVVSWQRVFRDVVQKQDPRVVLHDARPLPEFDGSKVRAIRGGHIPGAIHLTGSDAANNKDQTFKAAQDIRAAFVRAGITPDKTVYTYCHSSDRAAHAYVVLKHLLGYPDVRIYEGAWKEWGSLTALPAAAENYQ